MIESLCREKSPFWVKRMLDKGFADIIPLVYDKAMYEITDRTAQKILQCLSKAQRGLSEAELGVILSFDPKDLTFKAGNKAFDVNEIVDNCHGFLVFTHSGTAPDERKLLELAHPTLKDYLSSKQSILTPGVDLFRVCIEYLLRDDFKNGEESDDQFSSHPLLGYVAENLAYHLPRAENTNQDSEERGLSDFVTLSQQRTQNWVNEVEKPNDNEVSIGNHVMDEATFPVSIGFEGVVITISRRGRTSASNSPITDMKENSGLTETPEMEEVSSMEESPGTDENPGVAGKLPTKEDTKTKESVGHGQNPIDTKSGIQENPSKRNQAQGKSPPSAQEALLRFLYDKEKDLNRKAYLQMVYSKAKLETCKKFLTEYKYNLWHILAAIGWTDPADYALKTRKEDIDSGDSFQNTALHLAAACGHKDTMEYLVRKNADPNKLNKDEKTAVQLAADNDHSEAVLFLLEKSDVKVGVSGKHKLPLHLAAEKGYSKLIKVVLDNESTNIYALDEKNRTALHISAEKCFDRSVSILLEKEKGSPGKCPVDDYVKLGHQKALQLMAEKSYIDMVKFLLSETDPARKLDPNPALVMAIRAGNTKIVELLLKKNIDNNTNTKDALRIAVEKLRSGADAKTADESGEVLRECLRLMAKSDNCVDIVERLLKESGGEAWDAESLKNALERKNKQLSQLLLFGDFGTKTSDPADHDEDLLKLLLNTGK